MILDTVYAGEKSKIISDRWITAITFSTDFG
jgi:hypothetical protein